MELRPGKILIRENEIAARIGVLAAEINRAYGGRPVTLVGVLDGCLIFLADLVRGLAMPIKIVLVRVKTYGNSTRPVKKPAISEDDVSMLARRHVLVIDDIYDSGGTLAALTETLTRLGAASLKKCILLRKERQHENPTDVDYIGFTVPDVFVVGYGLDYAGKWRNLPYIAELEGFDTDHAIA